MLLFSTRNIARLAFDNVDVWSRICKVPEDLLRDYGFLLKALRCGYAVDPDAYQARADDWLFRWHVDSRVNWSRLTPTCHIVLVQLFACLLFEIEFFNKYVLFVIIGSWPGSPFGNTLAKSGNSL